MTDETQIETQAKDEAQTEQPARSLEEKVAALETALLQTREDMLRALAETENVRRRAEKQAQESRTFAIDRFARDLLDVADTLSRALTAAPTEGLEGPMATVVEGVALTEKAMLDVFARHGLRRVGARGEKFDPNLHQAVAQIPSDAPAGAVAEVFQPGYVLAERTLRPAMVAVSLGGAANPPAPEAQMEEPSAPPGATIDIKA